MAAAPVLSLDSLFDAQRSALVSAWPALAAYVDPLRALLPELPPITEGNLPVVVVVSSAVLPTVEAVARFSVRGREGWTDMGAELPTYRTLDDVDVPTAPAYLLADVSTGPETLNIRPDDALPMVRAAGRTPLTLDEGVALVLHHPELFAERNAFQALATRSPVAPYTKRVPSFWVSKGAPRLGWCWAGNPHTWLGAASAAARLAPPAA